jgi:glutamate synthase domain-containing protein 3
MGDPLSNESGEEEANQKQSAQDINKAISDLLQRSSRVRISGLNGQDNIAVGLSGDYEIDIKGDAGRYLGAFNSGPVIILQGSCGDLAADNLMNGGLIISGSCGRKCGLGMTGGILVVKGDCGTDLGRFNHNGTIIVDGDVDGNAGEGMKGGRIMITGDVKGLIGKDLQGGSIFVIGTVGNIPPQIKETKPDTKDLQKLKRYLDHYGVEATAKSFRKYTRSEVK